jgi:hypothetical protein
VVLANLPDLILLFCIASAFVYLLQLPGVDHGDSIDQIRMVRREVELSLAQSSQRYDEVMASLQ